MSSRARDDTKIFGFICCRYFNRMFVLYTCCPKQRSEDYLYFLSQYLPLFPFNNIHKYYINSIHLPTSLTYFTVWTLISSPYYGLHVNGWMETVAMVVVTTTCAKEKFSDIPHVPTLNTACSTVDSICSKRTCIVIIR